jgi:hypothetical protein
MKYWVKGPFFLLGQLSLAGTNMHSAFNNFRMDDEVLIQNLTISGIQAVVISKHG